MAERGQEHGGAGGGSWWGRLRALPNESPLKTVVVTLAVALVGSLLVAGSAVLLRPLQVANKEAERRSHVTEIEMRLPGGAARLASADGLEVEARVVDLESGRYVAAIEAERYDQRRAAGDPERSVAIPPEADFAGLKRRAMYAVVYLVTEGERLKLVILPVRGQGYGSMLYGYLGLAADANTVVGLTFYEHGETPGLGALIDSPEWKNQWQGKLARDHEQVLRIGVGSGPVAPESPLAPYQVDGLTGATWTGRGITNLLHYWLGEHGFAPYLRRIREPRG
jgi:Na+-transporting NADH:ubiquinone oxidoreductase subunit C